MRQCGHIGVVLSALGLVVAGCGSSSSGSGTGGKSGSGGATGAGGATGSGGATGAGGAGTGGAAVFKAINPCNAETDYSSVADNTINFGTMAGDVVYMPKCLKVTVGATVTFKAVATESFAFHPLEPSALRGTLVGNPITPTDDSSTMKAFTFPTPGYYAYFCMYHGFGDTGDFMAGVVWVR